MTNYESLRGSDRFKAEGVRLRQEVEGIAKVCHPARSRPTELSKIRSWKCLLNVKILLMVPSPVSRSLTASAASAHSLKDALHTAMNLEIRFRTQTGITIKGVCALFQQEKMTVEKKVRSPKSLISSQLGFYLVPKDPVKQLHDVPVPQAEAPAYIKETIFLSNCKGLRLYKYYTAILVTIRLAGFMVGRQGKR